MVLIGAVRVVVVRVGVVRAGVVRVGIGKDEADGLVPGRHHLAVRQLPPSPQLHLAVDLD